QQSSLQMWPAGHRGELLLAAAGDEVLPILLAQNDQPAGGAANQGQVQAEATGIESTDHAAQSAGAATADATDTASDEIAPAFDPRQEVHEFELTFAELISRDALVRLLQNDA